MKSVRKPCIYVLIFIGVLFSSPAQASKLIEVKVIDRDYLMVRFYDGEVQFVDDGLGPDALTDKFKRDNCKAVYYGSALDTTNAVLPASWVIKSGDDANYGTGGLNPVICYRSAKLNGMSQEYWDTPAGDWHYDYTFEHIIYLELPHSLSPSKNYSLEIDSGINTDVLSQSFEYDIFNSRSEAVHVNLVGYLNDGSIKAADLHLWMGDGGARDYSAFEGSNVYIYDVTHSTSQQVGTVQFWKSSGQDVFWRNFTQSDVWSVDFTGFDTPGTYRIAIEGIGCSEDFEIREDVYFEPFRVSTLGFYFMRIGEDTSMTPVPRQPRYIPEVSPANTKVYITEMQPWHANWGGHFWDDPGAWVPYVKAGSPENPDAYGGHSDALDWDRHLGHVSIIYDMLLPYILTDGRLHEDDLGIPESGNGIPDIIDEARNEVDFWLRLRDGDGYSHGLSNPDGANVLYQAGNTPMAAWANAVNAAMLAYSYMIAGEDALKDFYTAEAVEAYTYASGLPDQMLNETQDVGNGTFRGKDFKMTAAAFLYNLIGDTTYEDALNSLCEITSNTSTVTDIGSKDQLYACVAYLTTQRPINYPTLYSRMKASIIREAKNVEANQVNNRPSRRATDNESGWFKTCQHVHRCIVGHAIADSAADRDLFLDAMVLEADWGLGRNSGNMILMTTATTALTGKRSIQEAYTSGRDDGSPGVHPGHTPYMNIDDWASSGMIGNRPSVLAAMCYPDFATYWPQDQSDFNTRYIWAHSEFTPQQSMRGKQALYGYLYALYNYDIYYDTWATAKGLGSTNNAPDIDADLDGVSNYGEYFLNGNPLNASNRGTYAVQSDGSMFSYIHAKRIDDPSVVYSLVNTTNLVGGPFTTNAWAGQASGPSGADNYDAVTNQYDMTGKSQEFIKLIVE